MPRVVNNLQRHARQLGYTLIAALSTPNEAPAVAHLLYILARFTGQNVQQFRCRSTRAIRSAEGFRKAIESRKVVPPLELISSLAQSAAKAELRAISRVA